MNSIAATLMISERLQQRLLPHHEAWRVSRMLRDLAVPGRVSLSPNVSERRSRKER